MRNDVIRQLSKHAPRYGWLEVSAIERADVIITNDVFTSEALAANKPLVKRMDGVFYQLELEQRNEVLNLAASQADAVIFISKFSQDALARLYPEVKVKKQYVALNAADPEEFPKRCDALVKSSRSRFQESRDIHWVACVTDWDRPEKRIDEIVTLAERCPFDEFHLIGTPPENVADMPANVRYAGYLSHSQASSFLRMCDAYVHLAYRDAAPKTVGQALAVGLPVLYAESGGLPELAEGYGVGVKERNPQMIERTTPSLELDSLRVGYENFRPAYLDLVDKAMAFPAEKRFTDMLSVYFSAMTDVL